MMRTPVRRKPVSLAVILFAFLGGCRHDPGLPPRAGEEPFFMRNGLRLYRDWCAHCHGDRGRGDGLGWATDLPGKPADLMGLHEHRDRDWLEQFIRKGRPEQFCPGWDPQFSPSEITDLSRLLLSGYLQERP